MFFYSPPHFDEIETTEQNLSPPSSQDDLSDVITWRIRTQHTLQQKKPKFSQPKKQKQQNLIKFTKQVVQTNPFITSQLTQSLKNNISVRFGYPVEVFVPHKNFSVHRCVVTIQKHCTGVDLIKLALKQYRKETRQQPLSDDPNAYSLRVAQDDGLPDTDWPALDKQARIKDIGGDKFSLVYSKHYLAGVEKEGKKKKNVLEFIHLKVFLPHSDYPRMVDVSPDILVSQLLQVLGDRYGLDVIEHSLMIVIDGEKVAIPEQLKYKPLYVCDLECVAIVPNKMHDDWILLDVENTDMGGMPQNIDTEYVEYRVSKISKFGVRTATKLGIDGTQIYFYPGKTTSFLGSFMRQQQMKIPMRQIASLVDVQRDKKRPRTFSLIFQDQTMVYETETIVEVAEIVQRLTILQKFEKQKRASASKRMSVDVKKQAASLSYGNSPKRTSSFARFFHKRSQSEDKGILRMKYKVQTPDLRRNSFWSSAYEPITNTDEIRKVPHAKRTSSLFFKSIREEEIGDDIFVNTLQKTETVDGIFNKQVRQWNVKDVGEWLERIGFGELKERFAEEEVDGEVLLTLTLAELKDDFELELELRKKLFHRISDLKSQNSKRGQIL